MPAYPENLNGKTADEVVKLAVEMADGGGGLVEREGRIDWEDTLARLESWHDIDLGTDADSPLIRRI